MSIETCYDVLTIGSLAVLVLLALVCLVRCILGPRISDRVMAVNMIGTLTIIMVVVFVVHLGEAYLADIALIYAMISFLSVVVLCKVYTGIYRERKHEQELLGAKNDNPVETLVQSEKAGEQQILHSPIYPTKQPASGKETGRFFTGAKARRCMCLL